MKNAAKTRVFLLLLAAFTTLLALTPPKPVQACPAYESDWCQEPNGTWCLYSECPQYNQCPGDPSQLTNCGFVRVTCCP